MITPKALKEGDIIYITAPAKSIDKETIDYAISFFKSKGFNVIISSNCFGKHGYFSGMDRIRAIDLQTAIDDENVRAIVCARGGYGCVRILDHINWANMLREPKWLIGFSDITVFHQRLFNLGIQSIHGSMPLNFKENSDLALQTLIEAMGGGRPVISCNYNSQNKIGIANGKLIGGNLSIIYSLLATNDCFDFRNNILFIEDLSEHLYHLDRMLFTFKKAGVFDQINGLIIGGMTDMKDTDDPMGMSINEIILQHFSFSKIPIAFDFPSGHIPDNRSLIIGSEVILSVTTEKTELTYQ